MGASYYIPLKSGLSQTRPGVSKAFCLEGNILWHVFGKIYKLFEYPFWSNSIVGKTKHCSTLCLRTLIIFIIIYKYDIQWRKIEKWYTLANRKFRYVGNSWMMLDRPHSGQWHILTGDVFCSAWVDDDIEQNGYHSRCPFLFFLFTWCF